MEATIPVPVNELATGVWGAALVVFVLLCLISFLLWRSLATRRAWFWGLLALVLALSGPGVLALADLWTASPTVRVVPGALATWAPSAVVLGLTVAWHLRSRHTSRSGQEAG